MSLTVVCLFIDGEYPYTPEYVYNLKAMCAKWIDRPHKFVCLTDQPWMFTEDIYTIPIQRIEHCFAYWTKLKVFDPKRQWEGRVLYLDLDTLIVAPLDQIIDYPAEMALTDDPPYVRPKTKDAHGRKIFRKFNSSVMVWDGGTNTHLFETWNHEVAQTYSGDQCWLGLKAQKAAGMPREWFPRLSEVKGPPFGEAKVILTKEPKNHVAVDRYPWLGPLWRL